MAKASSSSHPTEKFLIEEREEVMVCEKGHSLRKTHFLKPVVTSIDGSRVAELPRQRLSVSSPPELLKHLSSWGCVSGFWVAERRFVSWVGKMKALHEPTWRKAGIFDAIKASTYNITKNPSLLLSVAEKWCPKTNSFVFPWGEATITLEDVMVLLGFSVLGSPVLENLYSSETKDAVEKLEKAWQEQTTRCHGKLEGPWISSFLGRGDLEHEAFLVLWLSFYVFPQKARRSLWRSVFPIAVRLARGERIALAPAVLASVYRDLGQISGFARGKCDGKLKLRSLFKLVQVWTWERFKNVRPKARCIPKGEPRIAQWDSLQQRCKNVRLSFDDFDWRPYTKPLKNWNPLRIYVEEAMWVTVDNSLDDEFASFARCVRVSQLAGYGFVENYNPNRVAMQFGLAQDLPALVTRYINVTEKKAWDDYNKSLDGLKLYMPSRLARGFVTARYRDWWLKSISEFMGSEEMQKETTETWRARNGFDDDDLDVSPKVLPLSQVVQKLEKSFSPKRRRSSMRRLAKKDKIGELVNSLVSPSWKMNKTSEDLTNKISNYQSVQMKRAREDDDVGSMDEEDDNMTISQMITSKKKKYNDAEKTGGNASETLGEKKRKFQVMDNDDSGPCQKLASVKIELRSEEYDETARNVQQKSRKICDDQVDVNGDTAQKTSMIVEWTKKAERRLHEDETKKRCNEKRREDILERLKQRNLAIEEKELKLEARIIKVEKILAMIREWKAIGNKIKTEVSG